MKKVLTLALCLCMVVGMMTGFVACGEESYEIALVTDVGNIDDQSFNQGAWEGVKAYADENNKTYAYYRPTEDSNAARIESIGSAIEKGAKVVVCPGYLFETAIYEVQNTYPEVQFLLLDGEPHTEDYSTYSTASNTHCILYQEEQAGYFAGYAVVMDGYRKLGFLGGIDVPAVIRYGYGYVQGANAAAEKLGVSVEIKYWYAQSFAPSDEIKTKMAGWYADGTEIVFSCGGGIYLSATAAADEAGKKVVGVDVDQASQSDTIVTSAMKGLTNSVKLALKDLYANGGTWPTALAGKTANLGVADDCVGLPTATSSWRFNSFTVADYEAIYASVKNGTVVVSNDTTVAPTVSISVDYQQ